MKIENLRVPAFNTTLMGVLKGVADYYRLPLSDAMLYGGSGHAFVMNIHDTLCPSGPYCWNHEPFFKQVNHLGIEMRDMGFFHSGSALDERKHIEAHIKENLDAGVPCSLVNMEHQLITGYDDTGFLTSQPWPGMDFPPAHLTFGTWAELGAEIHVNFFTHPPCEATSERDTIAASLAYAVDLYRNPDRHSAAPYGVGPAAYTRWIHAMKAGNADSHGNWWNATVWAECRTRAADYFREIAGKYPHFAAGATRLAGNYSVISDALSLVSDKALDNGTKAVLLEQAAETEAEAVERIEELLVGMNAPVPMPM
ncbi:MAG TPA: hypothetical protein VGK87_07815 [Anaerolineae bacterium]|jgi:hypothetical protein